MNEQNLLIPYLVTFSVTFLLIYICYRWPKMGKIAWGLIFILAGIFNIYTGLSEPQVYVEIYGETAVGFYKTIINGIFDSFTSFIVCLIAAAQILAGIFLLQKKRLFVLGIAGGIIFLLAITPLGVGSAFPSTLFMAFSLGLLYFRIKKEITA